MSAWFETVFARTIPHEGGFQAHPGDRGNWTTGVVGKGLLKGTKYGISAMTYPDEDIENLSLDQAKMLYFADWWEKMGMRGWPEALSYQMFDAAINHGMATANRLLQRALKVDDDGVIGPITLAALEQADVNDLCFLFLAERLEYFTNLGRFVDFGKGWCRRIARNLRYAAEDTPNEPVADKPDSGAAEQNLGFDLSRPTEEVGGANPAGGTGTKRPIKGFGGEHGGYSGRSSKPA